MEPINQDDILEILRILNESDFDELHLEMGDLKLVVKKGNGKERAVRQLETRTEELHQPPVVGNQPEAAGGQQIETTVAIPSEGTAKKGEPVVVPLEEEGFIPIKAPMLGTFYSAPKPGAPPFVEVGQFVTEEDTVCIIEVMKLFNTIKAGVHGRIAKICAENAQLVEFKQILFLVEKVDEGENPQEEHPK